MSDTGYYPKQRMDDAMRRAWTDRSSHADDPGRNRVRLGDHPMRSWLASRSGPSGADSREGRQRAHSKLSRASPIRAMNTSSSDAVERCQCSSGRV